MRSASDILEDILAIETGAGRIEGAFLADPELGYIWRAQTALTEACRSVSLEDILVRESDIATRPLRTNPDNFEAARGAWLAGELLRVILSPGDVLKDPERAVRRCLQAGLRPGGNEEEVDEGDADLHLAIRSSLAGAPGPLVGSLRAALTLRMRTASLSPSAERLMMICADHSLREGRTGREITDILPEGLGLSAEPGEPRWILLPATALSADGFRIWSPGSPQGLANLLTGLRREVGRGLGSLPVLRKWKREAQALCSGKRAGASVRDLVHLVSRRPILTGAGVSDALGVTPRTALNLLNEATEAGLLEELTRRRSYRAWAAIPMAQRIRSVDRQPSGYERLSGPSGPKTSDTPDGDEEALASLDEALLHADRILERYGMQAERRDQREDYDDPFGSE